MNEPKANFFDKENAKALVLLAQEAYAAPEQDGFRSVAEDGTKTDIVFSSSTDTLAVVVETATDLSVAFRGTTKRFVDWEHDLDLRFTTLKFQGVRFRIHTGFYEDVNSVWTPLSKRVAAAFDAGKRIWIGGHSKGGAEGKLFAWLLWRVETIRISGIYTCGEPRSLGHAARNDFETYLGDRSFRVIDAADIVPHVPLPPLFLHDGDAVFYENGEARDSAPFWFILRKAAVLWLRWLLRLRLIGVYDHGVALYAKLFP